MKEDIEDYINSHISREPAILGKIERESNLRFVNGRMCSGHIQGRLLKMIVRMIQPMRVVELGTFTGYSALCMAEGLPKGGSIDTIESDDEMEEVILDNLNSSPYGNKVRLHIGEALKIMDQWGANHFDLALIDADKREYPDYFRKLLNIVKPGGFIIADNTLWDGHVAEEGKHSSQTQGIMRFNDIVAQCEDVEVAMIPVRDGITLIYKKEIHDSSICLR